jgi:hypothetical protein
LRGRGGAGGRSAKKRDIRLKIANIVANTAKELNAAVVLEMLSKQCLKYMIKDVKTPC